MVFSGLMFLFRFLPAVLLVYYISPKRFRNAVLFIFSLIFYAWGEPVYVCLMLFSTVVDYIHGRLAEKYVQSGQHTRARLVVASSVFINLALLGFFKYADFIIQVLNQATGLTLTPLNLPLPVGISFYTFQTMSYTIDVYRKEARAQHNILTFGCYVAMFPQLIAGPIVRFKTIAGQLRHRRESVEQFAAGIGRFTIGLGKKVLLANNAGLLWDTVSLGDITSVLSAWLGILAFGFQIYFDFSGYSDMAIGLGKMFGFEFLENFNYPYISKSITEFWRRWHISLGQWFREYVYIPLGGNRHHPLRNIMIVWFFTGLWHGASLNFILWGVYYGAFLLLEKFVLKRRMERWPCWALHGYTLIIVYFGWILFAYEDMASMGAHFMALFGVGCSAVWGSGIYLLYTNLLLILIMVVGSTPWPGRVFARIAGRLGTSRRGGAVLCAIKLLVGAAIWIMSLAYLVDATYNPFLYFRF